MRLRTVGARGDTCGLDRRAAVTRCDGQVELAGARCRCVIMGARTRLLMPPMRTTCHARAHTCMHTHTHTNTHTHTHGGFAQCSRVCLVTHAPPMPRHCTHTHAYAHMHTGFLMGGVDWQAVMTQLILTAALIPALRAAASSSPSTNQPAPASSGLQSVGNARKLTFIDLTSLVAWHSLVAEQGPNPHRLRLLA